MVTARLPAISDIAVRTGACPDSSSIASRPTAVASRAGQGPEVLRARGGEPPEAEHDLVPLELLVLLRVGCEDGRDERGAREDLVPAVGDLRPRRLVVGVGVAGVEPGV